MTRRQRTAKQRLAIFDRDGGMCHICGERIDGTREAWELEHKVPYALMRDDSDENLSPAHVRCHAEKTRDDKGTIAKASRVREKHQGARKAKRPIMGSKASGWKQKIGGGWEKRE